MRPAVVDFAKAMENKLALKDPQHPNGWGVDSDEVLKDRLLDRVVALNNAVIAGDSVTIKAKSVDVANFAMMLYNKQGAV